MYARCITGEIVIVKVYSTHAKYANTSNLPHLKLAFFILLWLSKSNRAGDDGEQHRAPAEPASASRPAIPACQCCWISSPLGITQPAAPVAVSPVTHWHQRQVI